MSSLLFQEKRSFFSFGDSKSKGLEALENQGLAVYMYQYWDTIYQGRESQHTCRTSIASLAYDKKCT